MQTLKVRRIFKIWEFLKYEIRKFTIDYSKNKAKSDVKKFHFRKKIKRFEAKPK